MKKFTLKLYDGLRSTVTQPTTRPEHASVVETLRPEFFQVAKTIRHGFPYQPTALAFDPVQKLLAVGTKHGSVRLIGQPGVDSHLQHATDDAVIQIVFLPNEGAFVTATQDDSIHLWNFRQKQPEIVHTLQFKREKITCINLPFKSKWLYVGTDRGNIHVVNIEVFQLSGYIINWNKAIELLRKTHPGAVVHISDCPVDPSKLLIGFDSGQIVVWDLRTRTADARYQNAEQLRSISWHHEGKQFMCSHSDGSLTTWTLKQTSPKPTNIIFPHAKTNKEGKQDTCKPIQKVEWTTCKNSESFVIFSGGLTNDFAGRTPSITVMHGRTTTVLEMEHNVVDFITLCETPWLYDHGEPYALAVLLQNDLVMVDLHTQGYPCFENPYSMDLHESPVTCCSYLADCPADLIPALYPIGARSQKKTGFSDKKWPITGGAWGSTSCSYSELIITGHADGSLKFWDASSVSLQILYKLKTSKVFEKPKTKSVEGDEDPFAVQHIAFCAESRLLCIAGATTHVIFFKFSKQETAGEVTCLEIPIVYDGYESGTASPDYDFAPQVVTNIRARRKDSSVWPLNEPFSKRVGASLEYVVPIHVRGGIQKKPPGYQADLVCLTPRINGDPPGPVTALAINSSYGLIAYGNESGLVIVDYVQKVCLLSMGTPELYGTADPYQRAPRSPKKLDPARDDERSKSPSSDQEVKDESNYEAQKQELQNDRKVARGGRRVNAKFDESPNNAKESILDFKKLFWKDNKHRILNRDNSRLKGIEGHLSQRGDSLQVQGERGEEKEATPEGDDSQEPLICETAEEAQELPTEVDEPNSMEFPIQRESSIGIRNSLESCSRSRSVEGVKKSSKFRLKDHLTKLDARVRRAFSWEHSPQNGLPVPIANSEVKLNFPPDNCENSPPDGPLATMDSMEKLEIQPIPFLKCSPSTSVSSSPGITPRSSPLGENAFDAKSDKESLQESDLKSSLELFDKEGNPIPPMRRRRLGDDRPKTFQASLSPTHGEALSREVTPSKSAVGVSLTPTGADDDAQSSTAVSSPSNMGAFKTFISHIGKKGSSQGLVDKLDGTSFSRSRSSSISSLENITSEAVQCLAFADSYSKKNENQLCPTLWVGTSLGSVIQVMVFLPPSAESRANTPVTVTPSGTIFRLKGGSVLAMSFLDCNGALIPYMCESWKDANKEAKRFERTPTKSSVNNSGGAEQTFSDRQFMVIASDKLARVVALPSHNCVYKQILSEISFVVKAEIIQMKDAVCLVCYIATGHISIFSLPSLRQLIYHDFLPLADLRIARTFCFTNYGHGMYLCSPSEIQKFTISAEFCKDMQELLRNLFVLCSTPEPPKQSFSLLKGLFGGGVSHLDREELFGENSGKPSRSVAKHIPGSNSPLESLNIRAGSVAGEVNKTRMQLLERGEKLEKLDDQTAKMAGEAETFSNTAHNLMLKYKDRKWYQL